uniref:Uncharacterized protein n=1 Tax=Romanomermis culicivorax TaxID=13658 RepID=A0A915I282_ROMCU
MYKDNIEENVPVPHRGTGTVPARPLSQKFWGSLTPGQKKSSDRTPCRPRGPVTRAAVSISTSTY